MNDGLRHRLVGAVVLICAALILWPIIFSDAIGPVVDRRTEIPVGPDYEKFEIETAQPIVSVAPAKEPERVREEPVKEHIGKEEPAKVDAPSPESKSSAPAPPVKSPAAQVVKASETAKKAPIESPPAGALDDAGLPVSWVLQVAAFGQSSNAIALKEKLQKRGFKAYTQRIQSGGKETTRVLVGPKISKQVLLDDKATIDAAFGLNTLVVQYEP